MGKLGVAEDFYRQALYELERAKKENSLTLLRNAAEKAWGAVVQATDELLLKKGFSKPKSHRERRQMIQELERKNPQVKALNLADRFMARESQLHAECFYDGICPPVLIEEAIKEKVKSYIEDINRLGL